jgi:hypothetical protein
VRKLLILRWAKFVKRVGVKRKSAGNEPALYVALPAENVTTLLLNVKRKAEKRRGRQKKKGREKTAPGWNAPGAACR